MRLKTELRYRQILAEAKLLKGDPEQLHELEALKATRLGEA